jgi:hypothetical protein
MHTRLELLALNNKPREKETRRRSLASRSTLDREGGCRTSEVCVGVNILQNTSKGMIFGKTAGGENFMTYADSDKTTRLITWRVAWTDPEF